MASLRTLSPDFRPYGEQFVDWLRAQGLSVTVTSARRSSGEQARLYQRYLNGQSKYPAAPPGTSTHERGYAFDAVVSPPEYQAAAGQAWEQIGGRWGGRFKDPVHFEAPGVAAAASKVAPKPKIYPGMVGGQAGSRYDAGEAADEGLGPVGEVVGRWWTGLIPGFDSLTRFLSGGS